MLWKKIILLIHKEKALFAILFLATLLRFIGLFPNYPYPDEAHIQKSSWGLVKNILTSGDFDPHTFKYGVFIFYGQALVSFPILAGTYFVEILNKSFTSSFTSQILSFDVFHGEAIRKYSDLLVIVGRAEIAVIGIASVFLVFLIGSKLFNKRVGLISALIFAIAPVHVRDSHYITTDVPSLFFILLSFLFFINLIKTSKWKWFVLSGLAAGFASTVRFFPLALLIFPLALIFSFQKTKEWLLKALTSIVFILIGLILGQPFLLLDPKGIELFMMDMQRYALPWYGTPLTGYVFSLISFISSGGQTQLPPFSTFIPTFFRPHYFSFIFFNGFGMLPLIFSLSGVLLIAKNSLRNLLLLGLIPVFNFMYISFYQPASYDKSIIPSIPFLAIFAGFFISSLPIWKRPKIIILVLGIVLLYPFLKSTSAAVGCQSYIQDESANWVSENIPDGSRVSYLTMVSVPSIKKFDAYFPLEPGPHSVSLEEARKLGADYALINASRFDYENYPYFINYFITPPDLYENFYEALVLSEYESRAKLLHKIRKPYMCDTNRIYYYQLPEPTKEATITIKAIHFDKEDDLRFWDLQNYGLEKDKSNINLNLNSLEYSQKSLNFIPRIKSKKIDVKPGQIYTFSAKAKSLNLDSQPMLFLRLDFYNMVEENNFLDDIKKTALLLADGNIPVYFEKKRESFPKYGDPNLPGSVVALSRKAFLFKDYQKITITATAPRDAKYAILSIQNADSGEAKIFIDDVELLGP